MKPEPASAGLVVDESASFEEELGRKLLGQLRGLSVDRRLTAEQRRQLLTWVGEARGTALGSLGLLIETVQEIVATGTVADPDFVDLYCALERVVPVTTRRLASAAPARHASHDAGAAAWSANDARAASPAAAPAVRPWQDEPATEAQWDFIKRFRGSLSPQARQGDAAALVERLLATEPLTFRQELLLAFWGRPPGHGEGPCEVLAWIEEFQQADRERRRAWQLFRREHRYVLRPEDLLRQAAGAGASYLARINQGEAGSAPPATAPSGGSAAPAAGTGSATRRRTGLLLTALVLIAAIAAYLHRQSTPPFDGRDAPNPPAPALLQIDAPAKPAAPAEPAPATAPPADPIHAAVLALKLVGIVEGTEPRALIDGQLFAVGDVVDSRTGLKLVWIERAAQTVDFVDPSGRIFRRHLR